MKISPYKKIIVICFALISNLMMIGTHLTMLQEPSESYYNGISSSECKSLDTRSSMPIKYELESEQPRLSAVMERPTIGNVKILSIPVYFFDMMPIISENIIEERWDVYARDYYLENSYGLLSINSYVTPWIEAPKSASYYADDDYSSTREIELAQFLLTYWDATFDYNNYHYIFIIYPGMDLQDDTHFWPHVWTWFSGSIPAGDGVSYDKLGFVGEFSAMGTYAHEFGHSLGLVDYYSHEPDYPCGFWELMAVGNYNDGGDHPSHMGAYSKMELGWMPEENVLVVEESLDQVVKINLHALEDPNCPDGYYQVVKIPEDELHWYLVEFRDSIGYDAYLPDSGVMISYVDETKGSTEGRLTYIGGDHSTPELEKAELDDEELDDDESFVHWLKGDFELIVAAIQESATSMEVLIDCAHDLGTAYNWYFDLSAGSYLTWELADLTIGDVIVFFWDSDAGSGSDSYLQYYQDGSWINLKVESNIWQDAVVHQVETAGDYRVRVRNNNFIFTIDVAYHVYVAEALTFSIENLLVPPNPCYSLDSSFNVSLTFSTSGSAWISDLNINFHLWSDDGETVISEDNLYSWGLTMPNQIITISNIIPLFDESWNVLTISLTCGLFTQELVYHEFHVTPDVTAPDIQILFVNQTQDTVYLEWEITDSETGIYRYYSLLDGVLYHEYLSGETSDIVDLLHEGVHEISIVALDMNLNQRESTISVLYDETNPQLVINATSNPVRGELFQFEVSVSDNLDLGMNVSYYLNGIFYGYTLINQSTQVVYPQLNISEYIMPADQELLLMVRVEDAAGNHIEQLITFPIEDGEDNDDNDDDDGGTPADDDGDDGTPSDDEDDGENSNDGSLSFVDMILIITFIGFVLFSLLLAYKYRLLRFSF